MKNDAPTPQSNCSVCEQGHITLHHTVNTLSDGRVVKCWYYLCSSCGSEYADADLMTRNIEEAHGELVELPDNIETSNEFIQWVRSLD